jgi:hypothetical protein
VKLRCSTTSRSKNDALSSCLGQMSWSNMQNRFWFAIGIEDGVTQKENAISGGKLLIASMPKRGLEPPHPCGY